MKKEWSGFTVRDNRKKVNKLNLTFWIMAGLGLLAFITSLIKSYIDS